MMTFFAVSYRISSMDCFVSKDHRKIIYLMYNKGDSEFISKMSNRARVLLIIFVLEGVSWRPINAF